MILPELPRIPPPVLDGPGQVGATLRATSADDPRAKFIWERVASGGTVQLIGAPLGHAADHYQIAEADWRCRIRVRVSAAMWPHTLVSAPSNEVFVTARRAAVTPAAPILSRPANVAPRPADPRVPIAQAVPVLKLPPSLASAAPPAPETRHALG
jgi:hypothetical protein